MEANKTYHIDVTPEEDLLFKDLSVPDSSSVPSKGSFKKVLCAVLSLHVLGVIAIAYFSVTSTSYGVPSASSNKTSSSPTPSPAALSGNSTASVPAASQNSTVPQTNVSPSKEVKTDTCIKNQIAEQFLKTKEYKVKKGDTLYSISKKYKLSTKRLIEINKIKDGSKIKVGQTLKFM